MITINGRARADVEAIIETIRAGKKAEDHLPTYIEALASALDVPPGWLFDHRTMTFRPPLEDDSQTIDVSKEN